MPSLTGDATAAVGSAIHSGSAAVTAVVSTGIDANPQPHRSPSPASVSVPIQMDTSLASHRRHSHGPVHPGTTAASQNLPSSGRNQSVVPILFAPPAPSSPSSGDAIEDGYSWRKYGQKAAKGAKFPRSYFRCAFPSCPARKTVELADDGVSTRIEYREEHCHASIPVASMAASRPLARASASEDLSGWSSGWQQGQQQGQQQGLQGQVFPGPLLRMPSAPVKQEGGIFDGLFARGSGTAGGDRGQGISFPTAKVTTGGAPAAAAARSLDRWSASPSSPFCANELPRTPSDLGPAPTLVLPSSLAPSSPGSSSFPASKRRPSPLPLGSPLEMPPTWALNQSDAASGGLPAGQVVSGGAAQFPGSCSGGADSGDGVATKLAEGGRIVKKVKVEDCMGDYEGGSGNASPACSSPATATAAAGGIFAEGCGNHRMREGIFRQDSYHISSSTGDLAGRKMGGRVPPAPLRVSIPVQPGDAAFGPPSDTTYPHNPVSPASALNSPLSCFSPPPSPLMLGPRSAAGSGLGPGPGSVLFSGAGLGIGSGLGSGTGSAARFSRPSMPLLRRTLSPPVNAKSVTRLVTDKDECDDGYRWRKYGEKVIKSTRFKRHYYRCSREGCRVKRVLERSADEPRVLLVSYEGEHNHRRPIVARIVHTAGQISVQGPTHTPPPSPLDAPRPLSCPSSPPSSPPATREGMDVEASKTVGGGSSFAECQQGDGCAAAFTVSQRLTGTDLPSWNMPGSFRGQQHYVASRGLTEGFGDGRHAAALPAGRYGLMASQDCSPIGAGSSEYGMHLPSSAYGDAVAAATGGEPATASADTSAAIAQSAQRELLQMDLQMEQVDVAVLAEMGQQLDEFLPPLNNVF